MVTYNQIELFHEADTIDIVLFYIVSTISLKMKSSKKKLLAKFDFVDRKFHKACAQLRVLSRRIELVELRYEKACRQNALSFSYMLRLELASLEGVRDMFYEYASCCAERLEILQNKMTAAGLIPTDN